MTFHGVVDDYLYRARRALGDGDTDRWRHQAQKAYQRIGAAWWERELQGSPRRPSPPLRLLCLCRDETGRWSIGAEDAPFVLADLKGLHYLQYLVRRPGIDVEALALAAAHAGHPGTTLDQADLGDVLDTSARAAYRRRLNELDAELDAADIRGDQTSAAKLTAERAALLDQLRSATGLGGRTRRNGASAERARVAVRKAIAAALTQIDQHDPSVARMLRDTVRTGVSCRYNPNPDHRVLWRTE